MEKDFPANYSKVVVEVVQALSLTNGKNVLIKGSAALRDQLYAADIDAYEEVPYSSVLPEKFKAMIHRLQKMPLVYIGDIKLGEIPEWRLVPQDAKVDDGKVVGAHLPEMRKRLLLLYDSKLISEEEYRGAEELLKSKSLTPSVFYALKGLAKFHVVRWKPSDVLKGHVTLRDGRSLSLAEALQQRAVVKIDTIAFVENNKFTEISMVYGITKKGKLLQPTYRDLEQELKQGVQQYYLEGNLFKMLKRMLSLARINEDKRIINDLHPLLNSDLGRLYSVVADIDHLLYIVENAPVLPLERVRTEMDLFKSRLGEVQLPALLRAEPGLIKSLERLSTSVRSRDTLAAELLEIQEELFEILNRGTQKELNKLGLTKPPERFLP